MSTLIAPALPARRAEPLKRRTVAVIVVAAIAALAVIAYAGSSGGSGPLTWTGKDMVFRHPLVPGDRVLTGKLKNSSSHTMRIDIGDVHLLTSGGDVIPSNPVFLQAFGKSLWTAGPGPQEVGDSELLRTGRIALLSPGEEVPITIAWHAKDGTPAQVDYKAGSLNMPG